MRNQRITRAEVRDAPAGIYGDGRGGHGLMLVVNDTGGRFWVQRLRVDGKPTNLGLGPCWRVTLEEARAKALDNRLAVHAGRDPRLAPTIRFSEALEKCIEQKRPGWTDPGTERAWRSQLHNHCGALMDADVQHITPKLILECLEACSPNIARNNRARISAVLAWAVVQGYRADNPTAAVTLDRRAEPVQHMASLHHSDVAAALAAVDATDKWAAAKLAVKFTALTGARVGETVQCRWEQIDDTVWHIPAGNTKMGRALRVPLSPQALRVLRHSHGLHPALAFPSQRGNPIRRQDPLAVLNAAGVDATIHGFRASLRSWAREAGYPTDVAETQLGHLDKNRTQAAYMRSDLLEERAEMMAEWGSYIAG